MTTPNTNKPQPSKSTTMRIDLIPDISDVPLSEKPKASFVVSKTKIIRKAPTAASVAAHHGGYAELFQNLYDAGIVTDLRGRIREVNPRAVEFFGHSQEAFTHLNMEDIIAGADDDLIRTLYDNLQNQCFTLMQAYCMRADGSAFPAEVAVSQLRLSVPHLCFFVRDETIRRQMDEMLRTEHNALQNAGEAIVVTNLESRIDYANPAAIRLWGYGSGFKLAERRFAELFTDETAAEALITSLSADRYSADGVLAARRFDGSVFNAEFKAACNRDSDGNVIGAVVSFSDLTEREKHQSAAADAARLREIIDRLIDNKELSRRRLSDLREVFAKIAVRKGCSDPECQALVANGADCASALEALFDEVDDLLG